MRLYSSTPLASGILSVRHSGTSLARSFSFRCLAWHDLWTVPQIFISNANSFCFHILTWFYLSNDLSQEISNVGISHSFWYPTSMDFKAVFRLLISVTRLLYLFRVSFLLLKRLCLWTRKVPWLFPGTFPGTFPGNWEFYHFRLIILRPSGFQLLFRQLIVFYDHRACCKRFSCFKNVSVYDWELSRELSREFPFPFPAPYFPGKLWSLGGGVLFIFHPIFSFFNFQGEALWMQGKYWSLGERNTEKYVLSWNDIIALNASKCVGLHVEPL